MYEGVRVTDAAAFHVRRGELKGAVRTVRRRAPEGYRWRKAVANVSGVTGQLRGYDRMRVEEPIRELILDLRDEGLQREVVLDARRVGVDLDRGEILPGQTFGDLWRLAFENDVEISRIGRYTKLPTNFATPVDTAACALIGRHLATHHRKRAHRLWLAVPDPDGPEQLRDHHRFMLDRAERDRSESERWATLARALLEA